LDVGFVEPVNTDINNNFMNKTDGLEVFDDVGVLVGDEDEVHGFKGEIDVADEFVFDKCVLLCGADRFREVADVFFESKLRDVGILSRNENLTGLGTDSTRYDNHSDFDLDLIKFI
jgi:hypothetical protein